MKLVSYSPWCELDRPININSSCRCESFAWFTLLFLSVKICCLYTWVFQFHGTKVSFSYNEALIKNLKKSTNTNENWHKWPNSFVSGLHSITCIFGMLCRARLEARRKCISTSLVKPVKTGGDISHALLSSSTMPWICVISVSNNFINIYLMLIQFLACFHYYELIRDSYCIDYHHYQPRSGKQYIPFKNVITKYEEIQFHSWKLRFSAFFIIVFVYSRHSSFIWN